MGVQVQEGTQEKINNTKELWRKSYRNPLFKIHTSLHKMSKWNYLKMGQ